MKYEQEVLILLDLFVSYAKDNKNNFSDIDIAYKLDYEKFSEKYKDRFLKLLRIDNINFILKNKDI